MARAAFVTGLGLGPRDLSDGCSGHLDHHAHASSSMGTALALDPTRVTRRMNLFIYLSPQVVNPGLIGRPIDCGRSLDAPVCLRNPHAFADEMGLQGADTWYALGLWVDDAAGPFWPLLIGLLLLSGLWTQVRWAWGAALAAVLADAAFSVLMNPMGQGDLQTGMPGSWGVALALSVMGSAPRRPRVWPGGAGSLSRLLSLPRA